MLLVEKPLKHTYCATLYNGAKLCLNFKRSSYNVLLFLFYVGFCLYVCIVYFASDKVFIKEFYYCYYYNVFERITDMCMHYITGSTVVLTCCKGDSSSQWETPIFGPPQTENPLTDLDKICHQ